MDKAEPARGKDGDVTNNNLEGAKISDIKNRNEFLIEPYAKIPHDNKQGDEFKINFANNIILAIISKK